MDELGWSGLAHKTEPDYHKYKDPIQGRNIMRPVKNAPQNAKFKIIGQFYFSETSASYFTDFSMRGLLFLQAHR